MVVPASQYAGDMYARTQTWFLFNIQVGANGQEWLARQMDKEVPRDADKESLLNAMGTELHSQ
jgi:hypothetical protein